MIELDRRDLRGYVPPEFRPAFVETPRPGVAKPDRWQQVKRRGLGASIRGFDADQDIVGSGFGVFDEDIEVAVFIEDPGVDELEFEVALAAAAILFGKAGVRKFPLRILEEEFHVRVSRRRVEIKIIFLDVLAVVAFVAGEPEQPFLENRVLAVPEREREANILMPVGDAAEPVFAPAISAAARMIMGKILPGGAVGAVVFAHGAPLALGEVGSPAFPVNFARAVCLKSQFFFSHGVRSAASFSNGHCSTS